MQTINVVGQNLPVGKFCPLSEDERIEAKIIEDRIEINLRKMKGIWSQVQEDLALFQEKQLWRGSYDSFESWWRNRFPRSLLQELFEGSPSMVTRSIQSLGVVADILSGSGSGSGSAPEYLPQNSRQARELISLETPAERQEAAKIAHDLAGNPEKLTANTFARAAQAVKVDIIDTFAEGDTVFIANTAAPDYGTKYIITETNAGNSGNLIRARKEGTGFIMPFTAPELSKADPRIATLDNGAIATPTKKTVPSAIDSLSFQLSMAKAENEELKTRLMKALQFIQELCTEPVDDKLTNAIAFINENEAWLDLDA